MEKVKLRHQITGPRGVFQEGETIEVSAEEAQQLCDGGHADRVEAEHEKKASGKKGGAETATLPKASENAIHPDKKH